MSSLLLQPFHIFLSTPWPGRRTSLSACPSTSCPQDTRYNARWNCTHLSHGSQFPRETEAVLCSTCKLIDHQPDFTQAGQRLSSVHANRPELLQWWRRNAAFIIKLHPARSCNSDFCVLVLQIVRSNIREQQRTARVAAGTNLYCLSFRNIGGKNRTHKLKVTHAALSTRPALLQLNPGRGNPALAALWAEEHSALISLAYPHAFHGLHKVLVTDNSCW